MSKIKVNEIENRTGSTLTLGKSGTTIQMACGATQTGFGRTGTVDWCTTAKTSPFTAVSGDGFFVNTTSGGITVTLPSSPSPGDIIALKDYANTWDCNAVTLCRNGSKINGVEQNGSLTTESQSVTLIYVDGTKGWQDIHDSTSNVTGAAFISASGGDATLTVGNFKTHVFTSDGNFVVSAVGNPVGSDKVEYLVVGGGGPSGDAGAGSAYGAGGGGAGGFRFASPTLGSPNPLNAPAGIPVSVATIPVSVGAGGSFPGTGSSSVFSTITSSGGGGGARDNSNTPNTTGNAGASGGGGGGDNSPGGAGNTPPVSPPQGFPGGAGKQTGNTSGGGGGGASEAGEESSVSPEPGQKGGDGGDGSFIPDTFVGPTAPSYGTPGPVGSSRFFAGGGAGGAGYSGGTGCGGAGGAGGGGPGGGPAPAPSGTAGTANTGGGGGGSRGTTTTELNGGSGIVMIRYKFQ